MTPDEKWQKKRARFLRNRFPSNSSKWYEATLDLMQFAKSPRKLEILENYRRQLFVLTHPFVRFSLTLNKDDIEDDINPARVILSDDDEMLYLMKQPPAR